MKNLILFCILFFNVNSFCQNEFDEDQIVKKPLYSVAERTKFKAIFKKEFNKIELSVDKKIKYQSILNNYFGKITDVNKSRNLTKKQMSTYVKKNILIMNKEVKKLLTINQYNEHEKIVNRLRNSILGRIKKQ